MWYITWLPNDSGKTTHFSILIWLFSVLPLCAFRWGARHQPNSFLCALAVFLQHHFFLNCLNNDSFAKFWIVFQMSWILIWCIFLHDYLCGWKQEIGKFATWWISIICRNIWMWLISCCIYIRYICIYILHWVLFTYFIVIFQLLFFFRKGN